MPDVRMHCRGTDLRMKPMKENVLQYNSKINHVFLSGQRDFYVRFLAIATTFTFQLPQ